MLIHDTHKPEARIAFLASLTGILLTLGVTTWATTSSISSFSGYLPLHILLETLSSIIALMIFAIIWSTRNESLSCNLVVIALSSLAAGVLDFSHMLSFPGMPDYVTPGDTEKAIIFWLTARFLAAVGLLSVALNSWQQPIVIRRSRILLGLTIGTLLITHVLVLWFPQWLPRFFIPGSGATTIKVVTDQIITGIFLAAALVFFLQLRKPRHFNVASFFAATVLLAQGQFFFNFYAKFNDVYALAGHLWKVAGLFFLYRAVFVEAVKKPYQLLHDSRNQLDATLGAMPDLLFEMDLAGHYLHVFTPARAAIESPTASLTGRSVRDVMPAESADAVLQAIHDANRYGRSRSKAFALQTQGGPTGWFEVSVARHMPHKEQPVTFLVASRNITDKYLAEQSLRTLSHAIEHNPLAMLVHDSELKIRQANHAFTVMAGYTQDDILERSPVFLSASPAGHALMQKIRQQVLTGNSWSGELECMRKDGKSFTALIRIFPSRNQNGEITGFLSMAEDISEKKNYAAILERLSRHDQLTGLPNREMLQLHFNRLTVDHKFLAVLWLDLDNFKEVNDALGHANGDALLKQAGYRLQDSLQAQELVARVSGDDFAFLLPSSNQAEIVMRIQQLLKVLAHPFELPSQVLSLTASIGVAVYPGDADNLPKLLQKAEISKYKAKAAGRNNYQFYEARMQEKAALRLAQSSALKHAISNHELMMVFQPQVCLADNRVVGVEALARWNSRDWGLISPEDFIPLAESGGLILSIGNWALETAVSQLRTWLDLGLPELTMAVNISAIQFDQKDFVEQIARLLETSGIPPHLLELELTEAVAMKNPHASEKRVQMLHTLGVKLSIDDFGTGYSSLSYLKRFKIDKLKIDREFIREMDTNPDDQAIVTAVIQMASQLSISVLAEGVETITQARLLKEYGCGQIQGFYFSKPLCAQEMEHYLRESIGLSAVSASTLPHR